MGNSSKKEWRYIKKCLAALTRYYLGDIFADNPVDEVNEREICRILRESAETASLCSETCGLHCLSPGVNLTTCHAGLSLFTMTVPVDGGECAVRIVGGKVLTRMVDREECIKLAERAGVDPHRVIEAFGDVRLDSTGNLLAARSLLQITLNTLLLKGKQERKAAIENVALV